MSVSLSVLGWTPEREKEFASLRSIGVAPGRVVLEHNHVYRVLTSDGEVLAETAGRVKHRAQGRHELPVVGDWVAVRVDRSGSRSQIKEVLPRRSSFSRKAAGRETEQQVVAANIDTVFLVCGLDKPVNHRAIERYLVVIRASGASAVVVLNKADLADDVDDAIEEAREAAGDTPIVATSTRTGLGLDRLEGWVGAGQTVALLGPSGAGKSSLVNRLVGRELLPTGEVRPWDARGRHTSVHRQLVIREQGGLIIDTPGMRELQLWETDSLGDTFGDVTALAAGCRFRDCRHEQEPGCAVKRAVEAGDLHADRLESFLKLQREQVDIERKREERALLDEKRHGRTQAKGLRALYKDRERRGR
jgi:ribosome biogenesis GTPase